MKKNKKDIENRRLNRRQFLIGGAGTILTLPPLISLMSPIARAQVLGSKKVRAVLSIRNLGIERRLMNPWPNPPGLIVHPSIFETRYKMLNSFPNNNVSYVLDNSFKDLFPYTNLLEGLAMTGGNRQNHNVSILAGVHSTARDPKFGATIDRIMEKSSGVYSPNEHIALKAIRLAGRPNHSMTYEVTNGKKITSDTVIGDQAMFNALFSGLSASGEQKLTQDDKNNKLIVDQVHEDLKSLQRDRRLSSEDKPVLERYIDSVFDLQKKIHKNNSNTGPSCTKPDYINLQVTGKGNGYRFPSDSRWGVNDMGAMYDNIAEMIKIAFECDLTRVAYIHSNHWGDSPNHQPGNGGLHHDCPSAETSASRHQWGLKQMAKIARALRNTNDPYDSGNNLLDNSIMLWTNELGAWTTQHSVNSMPVVTFGKGGGAFKSGYYVDYTQEPEKTKNKYRPGRPFKQLLQSIMLSMGVKKSEYLKYGDGNGFGEFKETNDQFGHKRPNIYTPFRNTHNDPLPFITKT